MYFCSLQSICVYLRLVAHSCHQSSQSHVWSTRFTRDDGILGKYRAGSMLIAPFAAELSSLPAGYHSAFKQLLSDGHIVYPPRRGECSKNKIEMAKS
mmetsp:Transcript_2636/g.10069  ORF Transcript_2636/g.10069 Transcript_2636/m.10069 type:complete len:97 (+) Transcript_2636:695-985(+)